MASIQCGNCTSTHDSVNAVRACYASNQPERKLPKMFDAPEHPSRPTNETERAEESRQAAQVRTKTRATEGMYRKAGTIYKVQMAVHGSGKPYAKRLVELVGHKDPKTGKNKWKFEYAPGFVFELRPEHRLTIEQAREFGALYGTCCVCGRTLTNEDSIAAGIGPICAGKMF